jgi:hypothetical protein
MPLENLETVVQRILDGQPGLRKVEGRDHRKNIRREKAKVEVFVSAMLALAVVCALIVAMHIVFTTAISHQTSGRRRSRRPGIGNLSPTPQRRWADAARILPPASRATG